MNFSLKNLFSLDKLTVLFLSVCKGLFVQSNQLLTATVNDAVTVKGIEGVNLIDGITIGAIKAEEGQFVFINLLEI